MIIYLTLNVLKDLFMQCVTNTVNRLRQTGRDTTVLIYYYEVCVKDMHRMMAGLLSRRRFILNVNAPRVQFYYLYLKNKKDGKFTIWGRTLRTSAPGGGGGYPESRHSTRGQ